MVKTMGCGSIMRGFESHYPPHIFQKDVGVSPSGKATDSDSVIRRFESYYPSQFFNPKGLWRHSQVVRQKSAKLLFPSSNLGVASTKNRSQRIAVFSFFVQICAN